MEKSIRKIIAAQKVDMGGVILDQPLPVQGTDYIDPFLLIHHWKDTFPGNQQIKDIGVPPHPHRGFSPITFVFQGSIRHQDSLGNNEEVHAGGTQWMFAGKGITHSERPGKELAQKGGDFEIIQFWVNAPAKDKMKPAYYQPISKEDTPQIVEGNAIIQVVCGSYKDTQGAVDYFSPLQLLRVEMVAGDEIVFPSPEGHNTVLYPLDGQLEVLGLNVDAKEMVCFEQAGNSIAVKAIKDTRFMLLSGEPLGEKVTNYGPFVMNNSTEIMQAIRDAQMGKMGVLIETF